MLKLSGDTFRRVLSKIIKLKWIRTVQVLILMLVTQIAFLNCSNFEITEELAPMTESEALSSDSPAPDSNGTPPPVDNQPPPASQPPVTGQPAPAPVTPPAVPPVASEPPAPAPVGEVYKPNDGPVSSQAKRTVHVSNSTEFTAALAAALPGDAITLRAGTYYLNASKVRANRAGTAADPIFVRAGVLGEAKIQFCNSEGFFVAAPHWIFENLEIRGVCNDGTNNEHAFHITGTGSHVIVRNNKVVNFMSHVKTNCDLSGTTFTCPRGIKFLYNRWYNTAPIPGNAPFNVLNVDGSDDTVIRGNIFHDFASANTSKSATAIYTKMHSNNVLVEQNLVVCEKNVVTGSNRRGINVGDSTDGNQYCINQDCTSFNGIYRNNIVMNCQGAGNSFGIGVINQDTSTFIHNTVINAKHQWYDQTAPVTNTFKYNLWTSGFNGQNAAVRPQQVENLLLTRANATDLFAGAVTGNFQLISGSLAGNLSQAVDSRSQYDFCGFKRAASTSVGAIDFNLTDSATCLNTIQNLVNSISGDQ